MAKILNSCAQVKTGFKAGLKTELKDNKAQVWVETVLYTLIGLAIIGLLLAFVKPKIDEIKDKAIIEQTIEALNNIDSKISEIRQASGNKRQIFFKISKGSLLIDSEDNAIVWKFEDSKYIYSEPGEEIQYGNIKILTEQKAGTSVSLKLEYVDLDITYKQSNENKQIQEAETPYKIIIENLGTTQGIINIDFDVE